MSSGQAGWMAEAASGRACIFNSGQLKISSSGATVDGAAISESAKTAYRSAQGVWHDEYGFTRACSPFRSRKTDAGVVRQPLSDLSCTAGTCTRQAAAH